MNGIGSHVFNMTLLVVSITVTLLLIKYPKRGMVALALLVAGCTYYVISIFVSVSSGACELAAGEAGWLNSLEQCIDSYGWPAWLAQTALVSALFIGLSIRLLRYHKSPPRDRSNL